MARALKTRQKAEFGDFQTPIDMAREVCNLLSRRGLKPASVLEPTCGLGSFLVAALQRFDTVSRAVGVEINEGYVQAAMTALQGIAGPGRVEIRREDFFKVHWKDILESLSEPILIVGNPPWVTNAKLGTLGSSNLPNKSNFQYHRGIDAITGEGNFDISEWMLIKCLEWLIGRRGTVAMLCKTAVARKVLLHAWRFGLRLRRSDIYLIDAVKHFGTAVEACLLVVESSPSEKNLDCQVHNSLREEPPRGAFGFRENHLVADVRTYEHWKHLAGEERRKWRSGIKHDCSKVMELKEEQGIYRNGLGERVDLEGSYLYPMLKSADVANASEARVKRWMLVTQCTVGEDTHRIMHNAPRTWQYLLDHADLLDRRSSSIYRNRPRFSVFGVGDYSFAPWKVAISGLYKKLDFKVVGPHEGKPIVLDDTCYFLACQTKDEAELLARLLNSNVAKEFFSSLVFWDSKRPVTAALLRRLDLDAVAKELNPEASLEAYPRKPDRNSSEYGQLSLSLGL